MLADFLEILTEIGNILSLSSNHLIYEKTKGYIHAKYIKINDKLQILITNNGSLVFSNVISIKKIKENGFISILSENGNLIVNRIHASCHAGVKSHFLAQLGVKPLIYWYKMRKFMEFETTEISLREPYLHPYLAMFEYFDVKSYVNVLI